jgi:hypothetical protein
MCIKMCYTSKLMKHLSFAAYGTQGSPLLNSPYEETEVRSHNVQLGFCFFLQFLGFSS